MTPAFPLLLGAAPSSRETSTVLALVNVIHDADDVRWGSALVMATPATRAPVVIDLPEGTFGFHLRVEEAGVPLEDVADALAYMYRTTVYGRVFWTPRPVSDGWVARGEWRTVTRRGADGIDAVVEVKRTLTPGVFHVVCAHHAIALMLLLRLLTERKGEQRWLSFSKDCKRKCAVVQMPGAVPVACIDGAVGGLYRTAVRLVLAAIPGDGPLVQTTIVARPAYATAPPGNQGETVTIAATVLPAPPMIPPVGQTRAVTLALPPGLTSLANVTRLLLGRDVQWSTTIRAAAPAQAPSRGAPPPTVAPTDQPLPDEGTASDASGAASRVSGAKRPRVESFSRGPVKRIKGQSILDTWLR
jgi:hypothetical protein